jgi:hypothetical protein
MLLLFSLLDAQPEAPDEVVSLGGRRNHHDGLDLMMQQAEERDEADIIEILTAVLSLEGVF